MQGTVISVKPGTASNGNKFISLTIEEDGGEKHIYSTFDKELMKAAKVLNGEDVEFDDEENPNNAKYPKLTMLEEADGSSPKIKAKAKPEVKREVVYGNSGDRERRITELANLKSACALVGNRYPQIENIDNPEKFMTTGRLAIMVSGLFNNHINRPEPAMAYDESEPEVEGPPKPKPKKAKGKKTVFVAALMATGYDVNDVSQMESVAEWLENNYGLRDFKELTEEAQDKAIEAIKAGTSDSE